MRGLLDHVSRLVVWHESSLEEELCALLLRRHVYSRSTACIPQSCSLSASVLQGFLNIDAFEETKDNSTVVCGVHKNRDISAVVVCKCIDWVVYWGVLYIQCAAHVGWRDTRLPYHIGSQMKYQGTKIYTFKSRTFQNIKILSVLISMHLLYVTTSDSQNKSGCFKWLFPDRWFLKSCKGNEEEIQFILNDRQITRYKYCIRCSSGVPSAVYQILAEQIETLSLFKLHIQKLQSMKCI